MTIPDAMEHFLLTDDDFVDMSTCIVKL